MKQSSSAVMNGYKVLPKKGTKDTADQVFNKALPSIIRNPMKVVGLDTKKGLDKDQAQFVKVAFEHVNTMHTLVKELVVQLKTSDGKDTRDALEPKDLDVVKLVAGLGVKATERVEQFLVSLSPARKKKLVKTLDIVYQVADDRKLKLAVKRLIDFLENFHQQTDVLSSKATKLKKLFDKTMVEEKQRYKESKAPKKVDIPAHKNKYSSEDILLNRSVNKLIVSTMQDSDSMGTPEQREHILELASRMEASKGDLAELRKEMYQSVYTLSITAYTDKKRLAFMKDKALYKPRAPSTIAPLHPTPVKPKGVKPLRIDHSAPKGSARKFDKKAHQVLIRKYFLDPISRNAGFPLSTFRNSTTPYTRSRIDSEFLMSATALGAEDISKATSFIKGHGFKVIEMKARFENASGILFSHKKFELTFFVGRDDKKNRSIYRLRGNIDGFTEQWKPKDIRDLLKQRT